MKSYLFGLIAILLAGVVQAASTGGNAEGKRLHDANCVSCHDVGVYTRKDRHIHSMDALKQQLDNCGHMAKIELSAPEKQNIINFLNDQFYKFR